MKVSLNEQQIKAICDVLGDTQQGLTKTEITQTLRECRIPVLDDGNRTIGGGLAYEIGLNKRDWLYHCLISEISKTKSISHVLSFVEHALDPVKYTSQQKREKYAWRLEETNRVLCLVGLSIGNDGRLKAIVKASTLDEVDRRVNNLQKKLYDRSIHEEVKKYCISDYLRKDYYDAVFEASKGLAERVRQITGLVLDGGALFQTAFSTKDPFLFFNALKTPSEISEFTGLKELLESIFHLVRNPAAHTPKVNWKTDETKALDILTMISFAHKYLDECHRIPGK